MGAEVPGGAVESEEVSEQRAVGLPPRAGLAAAEQWGVWASRYPEEYLPEPTEPLPLDRRLTDCRPP